MDLQAYGPEHVKSFLLNYTLLVRDLVAVAAEWPSLDEQERGHHRAECLQTWGNRKVLGRLLTAQRLDSTQEARLVALDRLLFERAALAEQCFGLDLHQLLAIFRWGTPLSTSTHTVRIEVEPASLSRMETAFAHRPTTDSRFDAERCDLSSASHQASGAAESRSAAEL